MSRVFHSCPQVQNHLSSFRGDQPHSGQRMGELEGSFEGPFAMIFGPVINAFIANACYTLGWTETRRRNEQLQCGVVTELGRTSSATLGKRKRPAASSITFTWQV